MRTAPLAVWNGAIEASGDLIEPGVFGPKLVAPQIWRSFRSERELRLFFLGKLFVVVVTFSPIDKRLEIALCALPGRDRASGGSEPEESGRS